MLLFSIDMNVIFIEPGFPANQQKFPVALAEVGARVIGIGERDVDTLPDGVRRALSHYEQVGSVCDEGAVEAIVHGLQKQMPIDRLEATVEAHILPIAHVRERCGIPGTSTRTAWLCRDKPAMKDALREGGIPCAQSTGTSSYEEARQFAERVGYPLIIKPRDGAGAAGTYRVDNDEELDRALSESGVGQGGSVAIEEFIEGHEAFYDTITTKGGVAHDFITHYYPNVLEAMRARWISPQFISTNRVETAEDYAEIRAMGKRVIEILGIETSATHMEWFYGSKGLKFAEIGCRPPGVGAWDLYCAGNDLDVYREWAMAIVHGAPDAKPSRRFSAGLIALRPNRDGRISGYEGLDEIRQSFGESIIDFHFPDVGSATQAVEAGYMANAWIRMRHADYDELQKILNTVGEVVQVLAE